MKTLRPHPAFRARAARPAAPRCRNGVSSLLRLSPAEAARLPRAQELADWAERAASLVGGPEFVVGRLAAARA